MSQNYPLAINTEGKLTRCKAKPENRGKGKCNHTVHQLPGQSDADFLKENGVAEFNLSDLNELDKNSTEYSIFSKEEITLSPYRISDEEKERMVRITTRDSFYDENEEGAYIEMPFPVWNDMDKNYFADMTNQKKKDINEVLDGEAVIVTESYTDEYPVGKIIKTDEVDMDVLRHLEELSPGAVTYGSGLTSLNEASEKLGFEATKDVYVLPYYMRQGVEIDSDDFSDIKLMNDSPETTAYKHLFNVKKNPDKAQSAYEALLNNHNARKVARGKGGYALKSLADKLVGKKGIWRKNMTGYTIPYAGRAVATPTTEIGYDEVRIPPSIAVDIFRPTLIKNLKNHSFTDSQISEVIVDAKRPQSEVSPMTRSVIERAMKESNVRVLVNRQPTLHKGSMIGLKPLISDNPTVQTNPLINKNLNLDFDGDTVALIGLNDATLTKKVDRSLGMDNFQFLPRAKDVNSFKPYKDSMLGLTNILKNRS